MIQLLTKLHLSLPKVQRIFSTTTHSVKKYVTFLLFFTLCISLFTIEFLYLLNINIGRLGVSIWYVLIIILILYTFSEVFYLIKKVIKGKFIITFIVLVSLTVVGLFFASKPENLSLEATQEIACTINNFSETEDWGFFKNCFLGYPSRQFLLPTIPSLFSRSIENLQIGNYLYFLIGQILLTTTATRWIDDKKKHYDYYIPFLLAIPFHFHFFNYLNLTFEQAFYPMGMGLILCSSILNMKIHINLRSITIFLIISLFIISSYTTALTYIPIILLTIIYFLFIHKSDKKTKISILFVLVTLIISLYVSLNYRQDIKLAQKETFGEESFELVLRTLIGFSDGINYVSPLFILIWLSIISSALLYKFRLLGLGFIAWSILVFYFAISSTGYASPDAVFAMYRTIVIIPVIIFMLLYYRVTFFDTQFIQVFVLILLISGVFFQYNYFKTKQDEKSVKLYNIYKYLSQELPYTDKSIYLYNLEKEPFIPIKDGSNYFLPGTSLIFTDNLCDIDYTRSMLITDIELTTENCNPAIQDYVSTPVTFSYDKNNDYLYLYK